jgi:hypothetical protein
MMIKGIENRTTIMRMHNDNSMRPKTIMPMPINIAVDVSITSPIF